MHFAEGTLRAYADGEVAADVRARIDAHLATCAGCRQELSALGEDAAWAGLSLTEYALACAGGEVAGGAAWRRLRAVWGPAGGAAAPARPQAAAGTRPTSAGGARRVPVIRRLAVPATVAAAVAVAAGSFALPTVRAAAGEFLQLFRVQHMQIIEVSDTDVSAIEQALQSQGAALDVRGLANVRVTPNAGPQTMPLPDAESRLAFPVEMLQPAPAGYQLQSVQFHPALSVEFNHLNVAGLTQLLASLGNGQPLPADLAQADVSLAVPPAVVLTYGGSGGQSPIEVLESGNPSLAVSPSDLDVNAIRNLLLDLPFVPADLRAQLQAVGDWQQTALIPQVAGLSQGVSVAGTEGVFVRTGDPDGDTAVIWLRGDVVFAVKGVLTQEQALAAADSLR